MASQKNIRFSAILVLGLLSLVVGFLILIFLLPQLRIAGITPLVTTLLFLIIWLVVYISLIVGGVIIYVFKGETNGKATNTLAKNGKKARK